MHSVNNELVKAGHDFAKAISNDTPIIEIAKMVASLATQLDVTTLALREKSREVTASEATVAEIRNDARAEGIYFTANRMLAAWDAGFIDSSAKEVIDVARMILSAADMLKDATEGDFSRKFADEIMAEMAPKLRKEQGK